MTEIEHRAERIQQWRYYLDAVGVGHHFEWCLHTGLYETAGWTGLNNMFKWIKPGHKKI